MKKSTYLTCTPLYPFDIFESRIARHHFCFSILKRLRNVHEQSSTTGDSCSGFLRVVQVFTKVREGEMSPAAKKSCHPSVLLRSLAARHLKEQLTPNMSTLVLEGEVDSVRVVLCGTVVVDRGDREEEDAVIECSDGRRFSVVKATLSACSGFFR